VMSFASETRLSATEEPTCPAPSITILTGTFRKTAILERMAGIGSCRFAPGQVGAPGVAYWGR
jgi:hypothetical protein